MMTVFHAFSNKQFLSGSSFSVRDENAAAPTVSTVTAQGLRLDFL